MSQDVIELISSDDEEPHIIRSYSVRFSGDNSTLLRTPERSVRPSVFNRSPPKHNFPRWYQNSNTLGYLKRYRNNKSTSLMPTIVNVKSLARPNVSPKKPLRLSIGESYSISPEEEPLVKKKKTNLAAKRPSIIKKQVYKGPVSSLESICASIERCVRRYSDTSVIDIDCSPGSTDLDMGPFANENTDSCHLRSEALLVRLETTTNDTENMVAVSSQNMLEITHRKPIGFTDKGLEKETEENIAFVTTPKSRRIVEVTSLSSKSSNNKVTSSNNEPTENLEADSNKCEIGINLSGSNGLNISPNTLLFRKFLCLCASLETVAQDRQRAGDKLRSYHEKANAEYVESKIFGNLLQQQLLKLNKEKLYFCINEVLEGLRQNKVPRRANLLSGPSTSSFGTSFKENEPQEKEPIEDESGHLDVPLSVGDEKLVRELTNTLEKLGRKIRKIEEAEVDLDDEEDSAYFRMIRYKERFAKIYKKLCQYTGTPLYAGRATKKKIRFSGTSYPKVNKMIERWLNKTGAFPDFVDVIKIIKSLDLGLKPMHLRTIAADAFREIGNHLQQRRRLELWDSLSWYTMDGDDPAKDDKSLQAVLEENDAAYRKKEQELIDKFVQKEMEENIQENDYRSAGECQEAGVNDEDDSNDEEEADEKDFEEEESDADSGSDAENENNCEKNQTKNNYKNCKSKWVREKSENGCQSLRDDSLSAPLSIIGETEKEIQVPVNNYLGRQEVSRKRPKSNGEEEFDGCGSPPRTDEDCTISAVILSPRKRQMSVEALVDDDSHDSHRRSLATKPFGSVGKVVEINYLSVENKFSKKSPSYKFLATELTSSNVLKDRINLLAPHRKHHSQTTKVTQKCTNNSKGLLPDLRATINEIQRHQMRESKPERSLSVPSCESRLLAPSHQSLYKCHGTVANGGSPNEDLNGSGAKNDVPASDEHRGRESSGSNPAGGGGGSGNGNDENDQEDERKKQEANQLGDENEDESEDLEGECEQDGDIVDEECGDIGRSEREREQKYSENPEGNIEEENGHCDVESESSGTQYVCNESGEAGNGSSDNALMDCDSEPDCTTFTDPSKSIEEGENGNGVTNNDESESPTTKNVHKKVLGEDRNESTDYCDKLPDDAEGVNSHEGEDEGANDVETHQECEDYSSDEKMVTEDRKSGTSRSSTDHCEKFPDDANSHEGEVEDAKDIERHQQLGEHARDEAMAAEDEQVGSDTINKSKDGNDSPKELEAQVQDTCDEAEWNNETDNESEVMDEESALNTVKTPGDDPLSDSLPGTHQSLADEDTGSTPPENGLEFDVESVTTGEKSRRNGHIKGSETPTPPADSEAEKVGSEVEDEGQSKLPTVKLSDVESVTKSNEDHQDQVSGAGTTAALPIPRTDLSLDMESGFFEDLEKKKSCKPAWIDNGEESETESNEDAPGKGENADEECVNDSEEKILIDSPKEVDESTVPRTVDSEEIKEKSNTEPENSDKVVCSADPSDLKRKNEIAIFNELPKKTKISPTVEPACDIEVISETIVKKPPVSAEDRVKKFLESAGSSLSITVTRKKPVSRETQQALEQLKKLKNISATRVARTEPEVMVIDQRHRAGPSRGSASKHVTPPYRNNMPLRASTPLRGSMHQRTNTTFRSNMQSRVTLPLRQNTPTSQRARMPSSMRGRPLPRGVVPRAIQQVSPYPVISSVQSYNGRTPVITGVRGGPARFSSPRGRGAYPPIRPGTPLRQVQGTGPPTQRGRGRGTIRGTPRPVPFVVLD